MARGLLLLLLVLPPCLVGQLPFRRRATPRRQRSIFKWDGNSSSAADPDAPRVWLLSLMDSVPETTGAELCRDTKCDCELESDLSLLSANCTEAEVVKLVDARTEIDFAEEDSDIELDMPTQPDADRAASNVPPQWNLERVGISNALTTGSGIRIWVLDTGVSPTHEELKGRVTLVGRFGKRLFKDCTSNTDRDCIDDDGHGTHVAAIAAGTKYGIAKDAKVLSIKIYDAKGKSSTSKVVKAFKHVAKNDRTGDIVNFSTEATGRSLAVNRAIKKLTDKGVHVFLAAGNRDADACGGQYTRNVEVFIVGASNNNNERASFSNWGKCLDLYAPGQDILAADYKKNDGYVVLSGTSMAAPHAAGVAALYLEAKKSMSPQDMYKLLRDTAVSGQLTALETGDPNRLLRIDTSPQRSGSLQSIESAELSDKSFAPESARIGAGLALGLIVGLASWLP
mmetsp:Transcript_39008/g.112025  ORF Transcript_39008/g.112025 Transcript_39008/m.112025 type:complete len:453 (+) Transcript_39008:63-1421(+)